MRRRMKRMEGKAAGVKLDSIGMYRAKSAIKVWAERFYSKPENVAAFEKWKAEREEAKNADQH